MTREEAIKTVRTCCPRISDSECDFETAMRVLVPELAESEDERIRKAILAEYKERLELETLAYKNPECNKDTVSFLEKAIAYLEKQKESLHIPETCKENANSFTDEQKEQKPAEWSEEDKRTIDTIVSVLGQYIDYKTVSGTGSGYATPRYTKEIDWLKSLPLQLKEAYKDGFQTARHAMALAFMNYLDENRPDGKMGLSNGECEDIDKAFKENDLAKIMRYVKKYSPQQQAEWSEKDESMYKAVSVALTLNESKAYLKY